MKNKIILISLSSIIVIILTGFILQFAVRSNYSSIEEGTIKKEPVVSVTIPNTSYNNDISVSNEGPSDFAFDEKESSIKNESIVSVTVPITSYYSDISRSNESSLDFTYDKEESTIKNEPTEPSTISDTSLNNDIRQSFESFFDFIPDDYIYVNEETYKILVDAYNKVDFFGSFKKGNINVYDFYIEKYKQLIRNEVTFIGREATIVGGENDEELFLNEVGYFRYKDVNEFKKILSDAIFYFFDMDECGAPELCIDIGSSIYIFKYIRESERIILWYESGTTYISLIGSKKVNWNRGGISHVFYQLDDDGEEKTTVFFFFREDYNKKTDQGEVTFFVAYPKYGKGEIKITDEIKNQGYYTDSHQLYYFKVTEEQYDELTNRYYESEKLAREMIKDVSFSYEDLFGEGD